MQVSKDQLSLPGIEPEPQLTDRLLFAAMPDAATAGVIVRLREQLVRRHGLRGRALEPARLHVSLVLLGDHAGLPERRVEGFAAAAARLLQPAFELKFDKALTFGGRSAQGGFLPFVLKPERAGQALLTGLREALEGALGIASSNSAFTPHLTLLYDRRVVAEHAIEPLGWRVREIVLVRSHLRQGRPYTLLGRWALRD